jgi:hypothetical protein
MHSPDHPSTDPPASARAKAVQQGRWLAIIATCVIPGLIAWYGASAGQPADAIVIALLLWGGGTSLWLHVVWRELTGHD